MSGLRNKSMVTIVVLGKYKDVFAKFHTMANLYLQKYPKVLVRDGHEIPDPGPGWSVIQGPEKFSMAGNANIGWRAVPTGDILYIGDDVLFTKQCVERLEIEANSDPDIGLLSPRIIGPCANHLQ